MSSRSIAPLAAIGAAVVLAWVAPIGVAGQAQTELAKNPSRGRAAAGKPAGGAYKAPRTPWGEPDLQGIWNNGTITPLERPAAAGDKEVLTGEETAAIDREAATRADRRPDDRNRDVDLAYNQEWWDRGRSIGRTSLIVDPANGRLPALTAEGQKRRDAIAARRRAHGPADSWEDRPYQERCLLYHGVPPLPTGYNNNYQIVQTPGQVAILHEMIHEVRIIPLDGRPHAGPRLRQWMGDSRGHWEGDTLVVETTNYRQGIETFKFPASSETLRVVERFTRTSGDKIDYRFTVDDPTMYTKPWTAVLPMVRSDGLIYEYACHEGNYGMTNLLLGARAQERAAGAAPTKSDR